MENNKLNGFNNGRDTTDGVGGKEINIKESLKAALDSELITQEEYDSVCGRRFYGKEEQVGKWTKSKLSLEEAIEVLCNALREDKEPGSYYDSWKANLACAIMDEYNEATYNDLMPNMANRAAERFLNLLINK